MALVRHARCEAALVALEIVEHVAQAPQQVLALGLDRLPERRGIGGEEVGRRHRIDELARIEGELRGVLLVQAAQVPDRRVSAGGGEQVGLLQMIEEPALAPGRIAKAPVVGLRLGDRLRRRLLAAQASGTLLPQPESAVPPAHLRLDQRRGIGGQAPRHREEGIAEVERIAFARRTRRILAAEQAGRDPLALRRDGGELVGHVVLRRGCGGRVIGHREPGPCGACGRPCRTAPAIAIDQDRIYATHETDRSQCRCSPDFASHTGESP